ncbi:MAG: hypothetical protein ACLT98_14740 [Eggerthellaceae bacterium]
MDDLIQRVRMRRRGVRHAVQYGSRCGALRWRCSATWTMRPTRCRDGGQRGAPCCVSACSAVNTWFMRILLRLLRRRQRNRETPCAMGLFADVDGSGRMVEPSAGQMAGAGVRRDPDRDEALDVREPRLRRRPTIGWCWCFLRERFPCATISHRERRKVPCAPVVAGAGPLRLPIRKAERGS